MKNTDIITGPNARSRRIARRAVHIAALTLGTALIAPTASHADWIESVLDQRCDPADIAGVTGEVRKAIEASVRRSEATIKAPSPIGDLSCLNDLMTLPLDTFSRIGGLLDSLNSGLSGLSNLDLNLDIDVAGQVCALAAQKWAELTSPLSEIEGTIAAFAQTPSDAISRIAQGGFGDDGTKTMAPSYTGVIRTTDSSGQSGSIEDYVIPDTSVSPNISPFPTYSDSGDVPAVDMAAYEAASRAYNEQMMISASEYMACRFARSIDGTYVSGGYYTNGYWDVPGSTCTFVSPPVPSILTMVNGASESAPAEYSAVPTSPPAEQEPRPFGQNMEQGSSETAPSVTAPAEPKSAPQNIWQMLGTGN